MHGTEIWTGEGGISFRDRCQGSFQKAAKDKPHRLKCGWTWEIFPCVSSALMGCHVYPTPIAVAVCVNFVNRYCNLFGVHQRGKCHEWKRKDTALQRELKYQEEGVLKIASGCICPRQGFPELPGRMDKEWISEQTSWKPVEEISRSLVESVFSPPGLRDPSTLTTERKQKI